MSYNHSSFSEYPISSFLLKLLLALFFNLLIFWIPFFSYCSNISAIWLWVMCSNISVMFPGHLPSRLFHLLLECGQLVLCSCHLVPSFLCSSGLGFVFHLRNLLLFWLPILCLWSFSLKTFMVSLYKDLCPSVIGKFQLLLPLGNL